MSVFYCWLLLLLLFFAYIVHKIMKYDIGCERVFILIHTFFSVKLFAEFFQHFFYPHLFSEEKKYPLFWNWFGWEFHSSKLMIVFIDHTFGSYFVFLFFSFCTSNFDAVSEANQLLYHRWSLRLNAAFVVCCLCVVFFCNVLSFFDNKRRVFFKKIILWMFFSKSFLNNFFWQALKCISKQRPLGYFGHNISMYELNGLSLLYNKIMNGICFFLTQFYCFLCVKIAVLFSLA